MSVNKVIYGTTVLVDLTSDTVTADTMLEGTIAHDKSGASVTGTVKFITVYSGTADPLGIAGDFKDGDIYIKLEE